MLFRYTLILILSLSKCMHVWINILNKKKQNKSKWIMNKTELTLVVFFSLYAFVFHVEFFSSLFLFLSFFLFNAVVTFVSENELEHQLVAFNHVTLRCHIILLIWTCGSYNLCDGKEWKQHYHIFPVDLKHFFNSNVWLPLAIDVHIQFIWL